MHTYTDHPIYKYKWVTLSASMIFGLSLAHATEAPFSKHLIQGGELAAPERGSLAGEYGHTAWSHAELVRGAFSLPLGLEFPSVRGPMVYPLNPVYSPSSGISEWGLGQSLALSIHRFRRSGGLDFKTDDYSSPWGRLVQGDDGDYYPEGLISKVRVRFVSSTEIQAFLEDGSTLVFGRDMILKVPGQGVYAWYLVEGFTKIRQRTLYQYEHSDKNYFYLKTVLYGGIESDFQYKVDFNYKTLAIPFVDYRSTLRQELDRSVETIHLSQKVGNSFIEHFKYQLQHQQVDLGPSFQLISIQKLFSNQGAAPKKTFEYESRSDFLGSTRWVRAKKIQPHLDALGARILSPRDATQFDFDNSGLTSLELPHNGYSVLLQRDKDYILAETPLAKNVSDECRPSVLSREPARKLMRFRGALGPVEVFHSYYIGRDNQTRLFICSREGQMKEDFILSGNWDLAQHTHFVDFDHNGKPDLIHLSGGYFRILKNISTPQQVQFATDPIEGALYQPDGTTVLRTEPEAVYFQDMNGDGIPDIVGLMTNGFLVWYGKGQFQFEHQPVWMPVYRTRDEQPGSEQLVHFSAENRWETLFQDLNGDGIADLLVFGHNQTNLFLSNGQTFVERTPPSFLKLPKKSSCNLGNLYLYSGDFSGEGNTELLGLCLNEAYTFAFNAPEIGLLSAALDGKGNGLYFKYKRADPEPGIRHRLQVLSEFVVDPSGKGPQTQTYEYHGPVMNSVSEALNGFKRILTYRGAKGTPLSEMESEFNLSDESPPLLRSSRDFDLRMPGVHKISETTYQRELFHQIPFYQIKAESHGFENADQKKKLVFEKSYLAYQFHFCPSKTEEQKAGGKLVTSTRFVMPQNLTHHLICDPIEIHLAGIHSNSNKDFSHDLELTYEPHGLPIQLRTKAEGGRVLQDISYNDHYAVSSISVPGKGTTTYFYDTAYRLDRLVRPDMTEALAKYDATDLIHELGLSHSRGGETDFIQYFAYDSEERLSAQWNNLYPSSQNDPLMRLNYQYGKSRNTGWVSTAKRFIKDWSSHWMKEYQFQSSDGEDVALATPSDGGWAIKKIKQQIPDQYVTDTRPHHFFSGSIEGITDSNLLGASAPVIREVSTAFGFPLSSTHIYQDGISGASVTNLELQSDELKIHKVENQKFVTEQTLDSEETLRSFRDEAGNKYVYDYDVLGRLTEVTLPERNSLGSNGITSVHKISYDGQGRLKATDRSPLGKITYAYKSGTDLVASKLYAGNDAEPNRTIYYSYDALGRILEERQETPRFRFFTADVKTYSYRYDGRLDGGEEILHQVGFLTAVNGPDSRQIKIYNPDGKVNLAEFQVLGWKTLKQRFEYQPDGSVQQETLEYRSDPANFVEQPLMVKQEFELDPFARLLDIKVNGTPIVKLHYNSLSEVDQVKLSKDDHLNFEYDKKTTRISGFTGIRNNQKFSNHWNYDHRGLIGDEHFSAFGESLDRKYGYTDHRLLQEDHDRKGARAYQYDPTALLSHFRNGNSEHAVQARDSTWELTVDGAKQTLLFDNLGRLSSTRDLTLGYGPSGRIEKLDRPGKPGITYGYDELGQRVLKRQGGQVVEAYFGDMVLTQHEILRPIGVNGVIVGVLENGHFKGLAADVRGSLLESNESKASFISPYGERTEVPSKYARALEYAAQGFDPDLGAYRMKMRDYDPVLKRFQTPDPLFLEQPEKCVESPLECNLYSYAGGNPVSFVDPSGLLDILPGVTINAGEDHGSYAAESWANTAYQAEQRGDTLSQFGANVMGTFASAWTPETSNDTFLALSTGLALGQHLLAKPDVLYHFTSNEAAAKIMETGILKAGQSGLNGGAVYATRYDSALIAKLQGAVSTEARIVIDNTKNFTQAINPIPGIFKSAKDVLLK